MSVRGLSYVVLRCVDLERTREFYEAMGLQLVPEQHGSGLKHYSCDVGGVILAPRALDNRHNGRLWQGRDGDCQGPRRPSD